MQTMQGDIVTEQNKLAKYQAELVEYQAEIAAETQAYQQEIAEKSTEYQWQTARLQDLKQEYNQAFVLMAPSQPPQQQPEPRRRARA
jgi:chromosome segregation ATPase